MGKLNTDAGVLVVEFVTIDGVGLFRVDTGIHLVVCII